MPLLALTHCHKRCRGAAWTAVAVCTEHVSSYPFSRCTGAAWCVAALESWRWPAGTPEAQGKAELLMAVISSMNKWQGYTVGASRMVSHVAGSLSKHRKIIHEVRSRALYLRRALHSPMCHLCSHLQQSEA